MNTGPVKTIDGRNVVERIGAVAYVECSAKTKQGVREAFENAARAALQADKRRKKGGRFVAVRKGIFSPSKFYKLY